MSIKVKSLLLICLIVFILPLAGQDRENDKFVEIEGLIADGYFDKAIEKCQAFIMDFPTSPTVEVIRFKLAGLQMRTDRFPEAAVTLEAFINQHPASPDINQARLILASAYRLTERLNKANLQLTEILQSRDVSQALQISARETRADTYLQMGDQKNALKDMEEVVDTAPTLERTFKLANLYYETGDMKRSERRFREALNMQGLSEKDKKIAVLRLALTLYQREDYAGVVELLRPLQGEYLADDGIITTLAWALFKQELFQEAYSVYSSRPVDSGKELADKMRSGRELLMVHEYRAAISYFEKLIAEKPADPAMEPAYRGLARAYISLGDYNSGVEKLEQLANVIKDPEKLFPLWYEIGKVYQDELSRPIKGVTALKKALGADPLREGADEVLTSIIRIQVQTGGIAEASNSIVSFLENYPDSKFTEEVLFLAARLYENAGNYPLALEHYRKIAQFRGKSPFRADSYQAALSLVERLRRWEDVLTIGAEFLSEFPKADHLAQTHLKMAKADFQLEKHKEGIVHLEQALSQEDENITVSSILLQIAWGYYKLGEFDKAGIYYARVMNEYPESPEVEESLYWLGWLAQVNNNLVGANDFFEKLTQRFPSSRYAEISLHQMATNYSRLGNSEKEIESLKKIVANFPDGEYSKLASSSLVASYAQAQNYRSALEAMSVFSENDPANKLNPSNLLTRGNSLAEAGNKKAALKAFEKLLELFPASEVADEAIFNIGTIYYQMGRNSKAVEELSRLKQFFPGSDKITEASYILGQANMKLRRFSEAVKEFETILAGITDPAGRGAISYLAGLCYEQTGDQAKAVEYYRIYLANLRQPQEQLGRRMEIAVLLMKNNFHDEAVAELERIKTFASNDEMRMNAQYIIGQAYEEKGDLAKAAEEYLKVTYAHSASPAGALMSRMRAGMIYEKLERFQDAIAVYQTVMENHKNSRFGEIASLRIEVMRARLAGKPEPAAAGQETSTQQ